MYTYVQVLLSEGTLILGMQVHCATHQNIPQHGNFANFLQSNSPGKYPLIIVLKIV